MGCKFEHNLPRPRTLHIGLWLPWPPVSDKWTSLIVQCKFVVRNTNPRDQAIIRDVWNL